MQAWQKDFRAYSRALYSNWLWHQPLQLLVDADEGLQLALGNTVFTQSHLAITHGHSDQVGDAIALGTRTGARLVTNFDLSKALVAAGYPKEQATVRTAGNTGGTIQLGDEVSVTILPALHSSTYQKDEAKA